MAKRKANTSLGYNITFAVMRTKYLKKLDISTNLAQKKSKAEIVDNIAS